MKIRMKLKVWIGRCHVCMIEYETKSALNPYPAGVFCPRCKKQKRTAPGVVYFDVK